MIGTRRLLLFLAASALTAVVSVVAYAYRDGPQVAADGSTALPCSSCDARHAALARHLEQQKEGKE